VAGCVVSAPGKILWIGGYSVLERPNVSFVTGVDKRVYVQCREMEQGHVHFELPQFDVCASGKLDGKGIAFKGIVSDGHLKILKFVRLAAEVCSRYFSQKGWSFSGVEIKSVSDPAFGFGGSKAGLGSSAAATVATVGALFELNGKPVSQNIALVHRAAQFVHCVAQGKVGSGFDVAAACFGGCKYVRYSPSLIPLGEISDAELAATLDREWDCVTEKVDLPQGFEIAMASFEGESAGTSEMVKLVNAFKQAQPQEYAELFAQINLANANAIEAMQKLNRKYQENPRDYLHALGAVDDDRGAELMFKKFYDAFRQGRLLTKKLGELSGAKIEPEEYSALVDASEDKAAFAAKLPGAGGGDAIAALCLSKDSKLRVEDFWRRYTAKTLRVLPVSVSNAGVRKEHALPSF
jgi:phosphomevalonate kinase